jgi:hypothetical protein
MSAIRKIEEKHGYKIKYGIASFELYEASGCSEDWGKAVAKINHTYVIELKPEQADLPETGFEYPENKIESAASEMYDGFVEYMKSFLSNKFDLSIVNQCKDKFNQILKQIQNGNEYETEENYSID